MKSLLSLKNIHRSPPTVSTSAVNSVTPSRRCSHSTATTTTSSLRFSSFMLHPQSSITQSSSYPNTSFCRCRATSSGPPSPPQTDPPNNEEDSSSSPGIRSSFACICIEFLFSYLLLQIKPLSIAKFDFDATTYWSSIF